MMQTTKRAIHPPDLTSKRSERRRRARSREEYLLDKQAMILGAPVSGFEAAQSVALRAAFGHAHGTNAPDEGTVWQRVDVALDTQVTKAARKEHYSLIRLNLEEACGQVHGVQHARWMIRAIRTSRANEPHKSDERFFRTTNAQRHLRATKEVLRDVGMELPRDLARWLDTDNTGKDT